MHKHLSLAVLLGGFFWLSPLRGATANQVDYNRHYSPLKQINRANVSQLKCAWRFDSHDEFEGSQIECRPLMVDGVLYATTPRLRVVALDAASGKLLWDFDLHRGEQTPDKHVSRGLSYWAAGGERRIFVGIGNYLYAINAKDGHLATNFGDHGRIDLRDGLRPDVKTLSVQALSPGVIYDDVLIQGTSVAEDLPAAPGDIRAYDVRTGKIRWSFHTIPHPGESGYESWPQDAWKSLGGVNAWSGLTLDQDHGLVFVPLGSAAFDFYGANRPGDNLFANCLLALDAKSGRHVWHYQFVKHDIWDRDLPSPPTLVRVQRNGRSVDAVAQISKSGFVWVFNRLTGESLNPIQTLHVPSSDVDGEQPSATQVLPAAPAPFARQSVTENELTKRTAAAHTTVLEQFRKLKSGPQFTPPSLAGTIIFPGFDGGGEWGGPAWDPETGLFYVNSNEMAWILRLVPRVSNAEASTASRLYQQNCSGCHRPDRHGSPPEFPSLIGIDKRLTHEQVKAMVTHGGGRMPGFERLGDNAVEALTAYVREGSDTPVKRDDSKEPKANGLKYGIDGYNKWLDPDGFPAVAPPWGTLNAINLNTNQYAWKIPFGEYPNLVSQGIRGTGSENYGGPIVTAGGLVIIGATIRDRKLHAFDKATGQLLWETTLPQAGLATPVVYEANGREYIVIAAGSGKTGEPSGGSYMAFALPEGVK